MEPLRSAGVSADLTTVVTGRLSDSTQLAIFRIVQETTTNILKHAHATAAWVEVVEAGAQVTVRVSDNGRGTAGAAGTDGSSGVGPGGNHVGRGLIGIGERVEGLGGTWTYDEVPGAGTTVTAVLPAGSLP